MARPIDLAIFGTLGLLWVFGALFIVALYRWIFRFEREQGRGGPTAEAEAASVSASSSSSGKAPRPLRPQVAAAQVATPQAAAHSLPHPVR